MLPKKIPVAKEGVPFIGILSLASVVFAILNWPAAAVVSLAATAFVLYFFRDPERVVPSGDDLVVSPADGRIIEVKGASEGSLQGSDVVRISIFMNLFDVHVNRAPISGRVVRMEYREGAFWAADKKMAVVENERNALLLASDEGFECTVVQVAGLVARRIVCWAEEGDCLKMGERFGLIRFGSRLDVYLPKDIPVLVRKGQRVLAGQTVLALKK
ncbi:MAG: phosphatidylserine decarboxylase family protein [Dissulfurimicrobium sp.]|uniref:phosphatidylserine decarboxylase family protein n=1 Tax=Dissulfurimicrobium TaxID=1769732 RepID=UPI001EDB1D11|nr:phosphatidylserine decarboxylase family protein [Dissulfurimicrobium hydrothermale]UKL14368.1 phosphatidylserine decarboxylase family protein [Dissulfurimicrobium hydrothermale]